MFWQLCVQGTVHPGHRDQCVEVVEGKVLVQHKENPHTVYSRGANCLPTVAEGRSVWGAVGRALTWAGQWSTRAQKPLQCVLQLAELYLAIINMAVGMTLASLNLRWKILYQNWLSQFHRTELWCWIECMYLCVYVSVLRHILRL